MLLAKPLAATYADSNNTYACLTEHCDFSKFNKTVLLQECTDSDMSGELSLFSAYH